MSADNAAGVIFHLNERIAARASAKATAYFSGLAEPRYISGLFRAKVPDNLAPFGVVIPEEMRGIVQPDDEDEMRQIVTRSTAETLAEQPQLVAELITSYARIGESFFDAAN